MSIKELSSLLFLQIFHMHFKIEMSHVVRKPTFCICKSKDTGQLRCNHEANQLLCFRYLDNTILLHPKYKISSRQQSPVAVQPGMCQTWSESTLWVFSSCGSNISIIAMPLNFAVIYLKFKQKGQILGYFVKMMQIEQQTVKTLLIRLLLQEQSDLGLHCLTRPICPKTQDHYGISRHQLTSQACYLVLC